MSALLYKSPKGDLSGIGQNRKRAQETAGAEVTYTWDFKNPIKSMTLLPQCVIAETSSSKLTTFRSTSHGQLFRKRFTEAGSLQIS